MLEARHLKRLEAAQGWLQLGNWQEAKNELEALPASIQADRRALDLRFEICASTKDWTGALAIAEPLADAFPRDVQLLIRRSVALHELKRTQEAYDRLLPALEMLPRDWIVPYNLTIYLCKLGRIDDALAMLPLAFRFGNAEEVKRIALDDPDFDLLWERIGELREKCN